MPQPTFQIPSDALKFEVLRYSDKSKATALDILEVIHNVVDQALAEGRTLAQRNQRTHPHLLYQQGPSENHREQHQAWEGLLLKAQRPKNLYKGRNKSQKARGRSVKRVLSAIAM
jgi:hypothetical protein